MGRVRRLVLMIIFYDILSHRLRVLLTPASFYLSFMSYQPVLRIPLVRAREFPCELCSAKPIIGLREIRIAFGSVTGDRNWTLSDPQFPVCSEPHSFWHKLWKLKDLWGDINHFYNDINNLYLCGVHIPTLLTAQVHKKEGCFEPLLGVNHVFEHPEVENDDRCCPDLQETYCINRTE